MLSPSPLGSLPNVAAFCRAFETGSFTAAAKDLGVTPQATSRSVARLEASLGVALFRRSTRALVPTLAARAYYETCREALGLLARGERDLRETTPEGALKISVPTTYGHHRFLPALGRFLMANPKVSVEVDVANRNVDFVREGFDLAIRMGTPKDASFVARKLGDFPLGTYASPSYLARMGTPKRPEDLAHHACIGFVLPSTGRVLSWPFGAAAGAGLTHVPRGAVRVTHDFLAAIVLARAGAGLVHTYDFLVKDERARGTLVEVLEPFRGATRPFCLLRPRGELSRAARALADFVIADARDLDRAGG